MELADKNALGRFSAWPAWREHLIALTKRPGAQVLWPGIALAMLVAALIAAVLWVRQPPYRVLFNGLSDKESGQIVEFLQTQKIPFRINDTTGSIEVPSDQVHAVRLKLATQGLPQGGGVGLEMLAQPQGLGVSQFMESARYQHALEVELARSIASLQPVQKARVHLALPKASAFVRDQKQPSASVIVQLHPGRSLEVGQVAAIVHLVAASIPGMESAQVMVVDQRGNLLTRAQDDAKNPLGMSSDQFAYARRLEQEYVSRIESLLMPILGPGRVHAQVSADLDFTVIEQTQERYDPAGQVLRSEQSSEERRTPGAPPGGIPGALSNQPPGPVSLAQPGAPAGSNLAGSAGGRPDTVTPQDISRQSTRNYEIDKTISRISQPVGTVRRLSIAVLVDNRDVVGADGTLVRTPLTESEVAQLTALVKEAVGFSAARGDSINVVNQSFQSLELNDEGRVSPWWQPGWMTVIGGSFGLGVLLLVLGGIAWRMLRRRASPVPRPVQVVGPPSLVSPVAGEVPTEDRLTLTGRANAETGAGGTAAGASADHETRLAAARALAARHPRQTAALVRDWMAS
ncbi:MAG TPA: flagellar basal-body MS-ring/collar protein FliF [Candidatus Acidoferrales bacterium]|nr:flagellar basal-body MS-ring/collar protein FliF [Candidatus Acidoferrales bacterium]